MPYASRTFDNPFGFTLTPWVKRLLVINGCVFLVSAILASVGVDLLRILAFTPRAVLLEPWTPLTYMFAHAGLFHLLFNMLILFFFGPPLEERWGSGEFLKFYLIAGLSGAALSVLFPSVPIVGASAAIYGLMFAFAYYWPDNRVYIWGILPVKAKWLVGFLIGLSVFYLLAGTAPGIAHLAHLGGVLGAFLYLRSAWGPTAFGARARTPRRRPRTGLFSARTPVGSGGAVRQSLEEAASAEGPAGARDKEVLDEVDRILDKISQRGLESLTDGERRRLEEVSRRFRSD